MMFPKLPELNENLNRISRVDPCISGWATPEVQKNKLQKDIAYHIKQAGWRGKAVFCETELS